MAWQPAPEPIRPGRDDSEAAAAAAGPRLWAAARRIGAAVERVLERLLTALGACLLLGIVVLVSHQVFLRYFLRQSPRWSEEMALLLMVWLAMVGAALVHRHREHIAVELVVAALPGRAQRAVGRLVELLVLAFGAFMVHQGWLITRASMQQRLAGSQLPIGYMYLSIPVGGALIGLVALLRLLGLSSSQVEREEEPGGLGEQR